MRHSIAIPAVKLRNAGVIKRIVTVKSFSKKNRKVVMHAKRPPFSERQGYNLLHYGANLDQGYFIKFALRHKNAPSFTSH
jgi:hypothetical protein